MSPLGEPVPKPTRPEKRPVRLHAGLTRDPVSEATRMLVMHRDRDCVAPRLDAGAGHCEGRLTLDHVKDEPRLGKRAASDAAHLVTLCERHHLWTGWATSHRPELRRYLRGAE